MDLTQVYFEQKLAIEVQLDLSLGTKFKISNQSRIKPGTVACETMTLSLHHSGGHVNKIIWYSAHCVREIKMY